MYNIYTNFEYGSITAKIKIHLERKEKTLTNPASPTNCLLNSLLNRDTKGVSNLYRAKKPVNESIINDVVSKWNEKADIKLDSITAGRSFMVCNHMVDDVYLKYIQFSTLHYRFYTNDVVLKRKLIDTDI